MLLLMYSYMENWCHCLLFCRLNAIHSIRTFFNVMSYKQFQMKLMQLDYLHTFLFEICMLCSVVLIDYFAFSAMDDFYSPRLWCTFDEKRKKTAFNMLTPTSTRGILFILKICSNKNAYDSRKKKLESAERSLPKKREENSIYFYGWFQSAVCHMS